MKAGWHECEDNPVVFGESSRWVRNSRGHWHIVPVSGTKLRDWTWCGFETMVPWCQSQRTIYEPPTPLCARCVYRVLREGLGGHIHWSTKHAQAMINAIGLRLPVKERRS